MIEQCCWVPTRTWRAYFLTSGLSSPVILLETYQVPIHTRLISITDRFCSEGTLTGSAGTRCLVGWLGALGIRMQPCPLDGGMISWTSISTLFYKSRKEIILVVQICFIWLHIEITIFSNELHEVTNTFTNSSKPNWNFGLPYTFSSSCCHLCLQVENNSDLLLRLAPSGWKMM